MMRAPKPRIPGKDYLGHTSLERSQAIGECKDVPRGHRDVNKPQRGEKSCGCVLRLVLAAELPADGQASEEQEANANSRATGEDDDAEIQVPSHNDEYAVRIKGRLLRIIRNPVAH